LSVFAVVFAVFLITLARGQGELDARALTFTTLIFANLGLIFSNLSWSKSATESLRSPNKSLWWVMSGALAILFIVLYVPELRDLFRFSTLHTIDLVICVGAGAMTFIWFELWKRIRRPLKSSP
jgi:Ca2+-transporting ATPase